MNDVIVWNHGSVVQFRPLTKSAEAWVEENLALEGWQWIGNRFAVDHRYAADVVAFMRRDGLVVA